jgi:hypothetical protein
MCWGLFASSDTRKSREGTAWVMLFLFQGLRVVGKTGVTRKELLAVVSAAMKTLH